MNRQRKSALEAKRETFELEKWYADCISDTGDAAIAYYGAARWNKLSVNYSSLLTITGDAPARAQYSVRGSEAPSHDGSLVHWRSPHLHFHGTWTTVDRGYAETLYSGDDGFVEWHCLQPRANAVIDWADGKQLRGLGYVERLRMTVPPWKLPIDELLWGHFLSATDSLVWIDWRGSVRTKLVLLNGRRIDAAEVSENAVSFGTSGLLTFNEGSVLREGKLGAVALAALSTIKKLLPVRILDVDETKWRSRARLKHPDPHEGWAIHEVVKWPR